MDAGADDAVQDCSVSAALGSIPDPGLWIISNFAPQPNTVVQVCPYGQQQIRKHTFLPSYKFSLDDHKKITERTDDIPHLQIKYNSN
jgi:hypothetical protein